MRVSSVITVLAASVFVVAQRSTAQAGESEQLIALAGVIPAVGGDFQGAMDDSKDKKKKEPEAVDDEQGFRDECRPGKRDWPRCRDECRPGSRDWPRCRDECRPGGREWPRCRSECRPGSRFWPRCRDFI